jgi:hypothetical protein
MTEVMHPRPCFNLRNTVVVTFFTALFLGCTVAAVQERVDTSSFTIKDGDKELIFDFVDEIPVEKLEDVSDGVYVLSLVQTRASCGISATEYLGFNNRTCSDSISPKKSAGPVMKGKSESMMWREWLLRVVGDGQITSEFCASII